jgi:hypothetical protein
MFGLSVLLHGWLRKETEVGPVGHSAGLRGRVGSSESIQLCWFSVKGCHVQGLPIESVCLAYMDWRGKCTCYVYRIFPCRVYINSNLCDSQI